MLTSGPLRQLVGIVTKKAVDKFKKDLFVRRYVWVYNGSGMRFADLLKSTASVDKHVDNLLRNFTNMCHLLKHNSLHKKYAATCFAFNDNDPGRKVATL